MSNNVALPFEVWQIIFEYLDFADQLKLKQLSILFTHLRIKMIPITYHKKLTDTILRTNNFKYLQGSPNSDFAALSKRVCIGGYFKYLQELDASGQNSYITDEGIKYLNLVNLNGSPNSDFATLSE